MLRIFPVAVLAALVLPASAAAATVSGTVGGGRGYTVMALAATGQSSKSTVGAGGRFKLKVPGKGSTLQLLRPDGTYFGPVVLRGSSGIPAKGGKLGRISLKRGFAVAKVPGSGPALRTAKGGAPLGAGNLGLVKIAKGRVRVSAAANRPGGDPDGDGVPNSFDADDNGNQTLDAVDPVTAKTDTAGLFSDVQVTMARSLNANAGGFSRARADAFAKAATRLRVSLGPASVRGAAISAVDVDCGALVYCRPGAGTATLDQYQLWTAELEPNASAHAGDVFQLRVTTPGALVTVPTALGFAFASAPALAGYDGGAGSVKIAYPAGDTTAGTDGNPLLMTGDAIMLRFWRPQRSGLGSERGFMDMGRLRYGIPLSAGGRELDCGAGSFTGLSPTLSRAPGATNGRFTLQDSAADAAPDARNLLTVTFDLGGCLRANGIDPAGQQVRLPLQAVTESRAGGSDRAVQTIAVCLPGCTPPEIGGPGGGGKADLVVESVLGSDVGATCDVAAQIANGGTGDSPPTDTRIVVAGSPDTVVTAPSIAAGGTQTAGASIPGACAGRTFTVTADSASALDELSEANNSWSGVL